MHVTSVAGIFSVPGFDLGMVWIDFMHVVDLGMAQLVVGNVFWELYRATGSNQDSLADLLRLVHWASKQHGYETPAINKITVNMIRKEGKKPNFKAKAAESRKLVHCVYSILQLFPRTTNHEIIRYSCVELLVLIYKEMYNWTSESASHIATLGRKHCILYARLSIDMHESGQNPDFLFWRCTPKMHLFCHLIEQGVNPKTYWAYCDESEIGHATRMAERVHVRTLNFELMDRYRILELLR